MGNKVSLEEELINFKLVSKQMQRSSKQCEKKEKAALEKLKQVSEIDWRKHLMSEFHFCLIHILVHFSRQ